MNEELKNRIAASVVQVDQDRHNIHKLAEDLKNAIPHTGLEAFGKSIRKLQLEFRTQGIKATVRTFSGEGARKFADWLKDMKRLQPLQVTIMTNSDH